MTVNDNKGDTLYQRYRRALGNRRLPAAFVDLDAFDANAAALTVRANGQPVRIASKSLRCTALLRRALSSNARLNGLMCFTAAEAAWLSRQGFDDLLVAYPSVDKPGIEAVCSCIAAGARIVLTVDSTNHLEMLERLAAAAGVTLPVSIEIDMSLRLPGLNFGVWRSPLRDAQSVVELARTVENYPHLRLAGVMGYEAQLAGVPDSGHGQRMQKVLIRRLKRLSQRRISRVRAAVFASLAEAGIDLDFVNAGGTGSLEFSAADRHVTEVTAGSGFYCSHLFDHYAGFQHQPAAGFALPIVRRPAQGMVTCLGGGYPASGAAGDDRLPQPWLPAGCALSSLEGAGEVQTPVHYAGPETLAVGDPVFFRHAKAGELCERFDKLLLIAGGEVVDEVPTYRGEGQCFL